MKTNSWSFPNIFNVAQNKVAILEDEDAIVSRDRLLILTEPTELYNEPQQGVGLRRYLWQYNTKNVQTMLMDRVKEQLRTYEPYVDADKTQYTEGNLFTGSSNPDIAQKYNRLELTISLETAFGSTVDIDLSEISKEIFNS